MRKFNKTGKGPGKGKPFKGKEGEKNFRKPAESRPYSGKPKRDGEAGGDRKSRPGSFRDKPLRSSEQASDKTSAGSNSRPNYGEDKAKRSFARGEDKPSFKKRVERTFDGPKPASARKTKPRNFDDKPLRSFDKDDKTPFRRGESNDKPFSGRKQSPGGFEEKLRRNFESTAGKERDEDKKPRGNFDPSARRNSKGAKFDSNARKYAAPKFNDERTSESRFKKEGEEESIKRVKFDDFEDGKVFSNTHRNKISKNKPSGTKTKYKKQSIKSKPQTGDGLTRLNKYLANAGVASRREADTLIQSGVVKVNGVVIDQLGYKISEGDKVTYGDAPVRGERKVYLLLNKPKDYITTVDDPQERKTVMELVSKACRERIYPVGRLDRNTTGLLLFTNDGEMTTKLTHPKFGVKKVYHVSLNKGLKPEDFKAISEGFELEDGLVKADDLAFVGEGKKEIGIEIHSGRNRIVRRIFEHLGYDVIKLDRVVFAGLTKKDLPRGKHRFLTAKEISFLQMIG